MVLLPRGKRATTGKRGGPVMGQRKGLWLSGADARRAVEAFIFSSCSWLSLSDEKVDATSVRERGKAASGAASGVLAS